MIKSSLASSLLVAGMLCRSAAAQIEIIDTTGRTSALTQAGTSAPSSILTAEALSALPYERLDEALAATTGFSLFRRLPSLTANPTIQGASLRGIGPNGAGRAAVLLDGAPLNDPFGNWVNWTSVLPGTVSQLEVLPGGRPLAGGPGALSGMIAIETGQAPAGLAMRFDVNSLEGADGSIVYAGEAGGAHLIAFAGGGQRQGYIPIIESQRGPADVAAGSHNFSGGLKAARDVGETWRASILLRGFTEGRDNGVDGAVNDTQGFDGTLRLKNSPASGLEADISLYGQVRRFASLFTATDAQRITTRPVLDQFSVPSYAFGSRFALKQNWSDAHQSSLFVQADRRSGETNERFRNLGNGFTRQRTAGGKQTTLGVGLQHQITLSPQLSVDGGVRVDVLRLSGGSRLEIDTTTGLPTRDDVFEDRSDTVFGGSAGLRYQPVPAWTFKLRGYTGSRQPSLNEYFRPFRVGNDITEANPDLAVETLRGVDVSVRFEPISGQFGQITVFRNWLRDAVGNLSVPGAAGGFIAPCGFVPNGGSCRQRGNIERAAATGAEVSGGLTLADRVAVTVFYIYTDAEIRRSTINPGLNGLRFAQVPRHQGSVEARLGWLGGALTSSVIAHAQSQQFEDDLNARPLDGFVALDAALRWRVGGGVTLRFDAVNLSNSVIEAGRSATGLITRGQPRTIRVGVSAQF